MDFAGWLKTSRFFSEGMNVTPESLPIVPRSKEDPAYRSGISIESHNVAGVTCFGLQLDTIYEHG